MFLEMMIFIIYIINGDTFLRGKNHFVGGVGWGNTPNIFTKLLQKKNMGQNVTKQKKKKNSLQTKKNHAKYLVSPQKVTQKSYPALIPHSHSHPPPPPKKK